MPSLLLQFSPPRLCMKHPNCNSHKTNTNPNPNANPNPTNPKPMDDQQEDEVTITQCKICTGRCNQQTSIKQSEPLNYLNTNNARTQQ